MWADRSGFSQIHFDRLTAKPLYVNTRALHPPLTGVQRYTREIVARLGSDLQPISPQTSGRGAAGHLWEQTILPARSRGGVLWSPANTGPLLHSRQIVTIHDMVAFDHPEWLGTRYGQWYRLLLPRLLKRVLGVITVSEFTKGRIIERFGICPAAVRVIPNGVDARFAPVPEGRIRQALDRIGIGTEPYVLSVGSLEPRKNVSRLLEAWVDATPRLSGDLSLVIAGALGDPAVFGEVPLGAIPPRVKLLGHVDDGLLPALYAGAIAFIYPSLYEGFGLPPLEAMACGTPVVVARSSALPEVVADAALKVDPLDIESIASTLCELIEKRDLQTHLRRRGLEHARTFTWERSAAAVREVLENARQA